jgi:hypothetical protein
MHGRFYPVCILLMLFTVGYWVLCRSPQLAFFTMNVLTEADSSASGQADRVVFLYSLVPGQFNHEGLHLECPY